ncbi:MULTISPECIES: NAD(P)-dependent oxidoreductase [unclassified Hydrogenophaga]|uniref:NAD(P)-dependent oxidoreductase n=1 Tax=unclassified Hydrogenophaga TaxID=2610897 RepID=UPI0008786895|nr:MULTISPECIES: NAD(P)-dependent oxidoreductase [unclassified Hydrogenophaga]MBN9371349.1 NAD(P)-dependent oxidoreductase [Hydrogenophaga sp.]OJV36561.1 MAG: GDP-mannose dehydrogenase [Hydrogenophaga sp. 70-12]
MKVHFIGVGKMGLPMARHLLAAGHGVTVEDPAADRLALAREAGLAVADGLAQAELIVSSLPHDGALLAVGERVAEHAAKGAAWVDTSTVSPEASARAAEACARAGVPTLRCTVSGNNHMAEAAQLTVMASGPKALHERLLPLLSCWGPTQFWLGEAEQARLMKLVVNLMIAQTSAMLAEALSLGQKGGLAWQDMWRVIGASAVASPIVKAKGVQLSQRDYTPTFTVGQMNKDIDLILGEGARLQVPLTQTAATRQLMSAAQAQGDGALDYAAIIRVAQRAAGLDTD